MSSPWNRLLSARMLLAAAVSAVLLTTAVLAQDQKDALQQRLAAVKDSMAKNQEALRQYTWTETTEVSLKGEIKSRTQNECHYGPDGKVVKLPLGERPDKKKPRGIKGKVVANKVGEMKDYLDRAGSLIRRYVPPDSAEMQQAFQSGKAKLVKDADGSGGAILFNDYVKPGDQMTLEFENGIRSILVKTYLDEPSDAVNLAVNFQKLADGPNYLAESVLEATAKQIKIRTTNFDHHR